MPQPSRLPHPRTRRHANRNLGLIVVAYILYGALLFGTSAIVAEPEFVRFQLPEDAVPDLLTGDSERPDGLWPTSTARLGTAAH